MSAEEITAHPRLQTRRDFLAERRHWSRARIKIVAKQHPGLLVPWGKRASLVNVDIADVIEAEAAAASERR